MRLVVTIDGELLASLKHNAGIPEQKAAIARIVEAMGNLLLNGDQIVICHGNAPQVGAMLLRSEAATHMIHDLPLDICGADTQGATGYMLQQAVQNWLELNNVNRDVVTLITQVVVEDVAPGLVSTKKGIGPFFDGELAQLNQVVRGWEMAMMPGFGCQRVVPLMMPSHIIEAKSIRHLVDCGVITICAGGGGVPVQLDSQGVCVGVEAVVDKAYTACLLAREIQAESIVFITPLEDLLGVISRDPSQHVIAVSPEEIDGLIQNMGTGTAIRHKLIASRDFLRAGGKSVMLIPPEDLRELPRKGSDAFPSGGEVLIFNHPVVSYIRNKQ